MTLGRLLIGLTALAAAAGCSGGSGPAFMRLLNDSAQPVQVREITQSNSPSCQQPGYATPGKQILMDPNGECVITQGVLAPGKMVALSLGTPKDSAELPPIVVVDGDGQQRCMILPFPGEGGYAPGFRVSEVQPGGCEPDVG